MPRPTPLPPALAAHPFATRAAMELGVGRGRLAGRDLDRPFRGVRTSALTSDVLAYVPRLRPRDRFSHTSALELWGAPLPPGLPSGVHVTMMNEQGQPRGEGPRARGVIGHTTVGGGATQLRGLPVSDPVTAFIESARVLDLDALIAVGDYLVLDPRVLESFFERPLARLDALRDRARSSQGRGIAQARRAAGQVREGVESPMETALRLLLVRAGLPEPVCGFELIDGRRRIGWFDLAWPEFRVIAEYDGDQHRTSKRQYERDIRRFDDASDADWRVIRVRATGILASPTFTVGRVSSALVSRGWVKR